MSMSRYIHLRLITVLSMLFFISACGVGGEVVKVTNVQEDSLVGLKKAELEKLAAIKKERGRQPLDTSLSNVIQATPHYSAPEFLMKYPAVSRQSELDYTVGGYDVLNIKVYEEEDLSREALRVSADGYISFSLIGRLKVDNLTTAEIEKLISATLAEGEYLLDAHVSVMVTEFKSKRFLVLGAVQNPGSYSLEAQERVLDAISKAGGMMRASEGGGYGNTGMIIRTLNPNRDDAKKIVINFNLEGLLKGRDQISDLLIADKDVLYVPTAEYFYVIGQVQKPGSYPLGNREITLVEAISMSGGFTPIAARNRTRIIRVEDDVEKIIKVKVDAITDAGKKIQDVIIRPNDVIVVPESFF